MRDGWLDEMEGGFGELFGAASNIVCGVSVAAAIAVVYF